MMQVIHTAALCCVKFLEVFWCRSLMEYLSWHMLSICRVSFCMSGWASSFLPDTVKHICENHKKKKTVFPPVNYEKGVL